MPGEDAYKKRGIRGRVWKFYRHHVRDHISDFVVRQRLKLLWMGWGYWRVLAPSVLPVHRRIWLVARFLRVDWKVLHAHKPIEIGYMLRDLASRRANPGEVVVEAGCWQGGSTAKFSLMCRELGYGLEVYDSFEGVSAHDVRAGETDFSGTYAAAEELVRRNVAELGAIEVCTFHKGWFSDTLRNDGVGHPTRMLYIDCDIIDGTTDALTGGLPELVDDSLVYSQDFHIPAVREYLEDPATWAAFDRGPARLTPLAWNLVRVEVPPA
ncbi:MAG TPA: TylF/MycF/NovP-related O-methyltransferase [Acidimicrobiales bacterium]|nr:TylF/MycF/NovP-related O-methyltransferase [Acidimicrobiales bacterium]